MRTADRTPEVFAIRFSEIESMQQVIINLILNAVEAMRSQPTRALSVASVKDGTTDVLVTVRDSGIGLGRVVSPVRATFPISIPAASGPVS
jgi:C4-dicarboxylate-specific signal transduction histidine kinase